MKKKGHILSDVVSFKKIFVFKVMYPSLSNQVYIFKRSNFITALENIFIFVFTTSFTTLCDQKKLQFILADSEWLVL